MAEITKPDMSVIWASGGAIIAPSPVKVQTGWTAEIPPHQWENWSQNRQDSALAYLFQRGIAEWDSTTEYWAGKSVVVYQGRVYIALTSNVGSNPSTNSTDWQASIRTSDFTGSNQSLGLSGYQIFPGGLILQWGTANVAAGATATVVNLPVAFPTAGLRSVCGQNGPGAVGASLSSNITSNSQISFWNSGSGTTIATYIALGY